MIRAFVSLAVVLALAWPARAQLLQSEYPIMGEGGGPVANHAIARDRIAAAEKLPAAVVAANPDGDVTLVEFYDLNCPYCRKASADLEKLVQSDKKLRLVLVPLPVLGIPSVLAGRVEIAVAKALKPADFYRYHRALYSGRGVIDGQRAIDTAARFNLDLQKIVEAANEDGITDIMKAHLRFTESLGMKAITPSYLVGDVAIQGHPGRKSLQAVVNAVRTCGKAMC